jgi:TrmH RNA methyltransferase
MKRTAKFSERPKHQEDKDSARLSHIAGLSAVSALFASAPHRVERLLYVAHMKPSVGAMCSKLAQARKPYRVVSPEELTRIAGTAMHGGIVAVAKTRPVTVLTVSAAKRWALDRQPLLIMDGVSNPHNLGAIARTAAFFGVPRMVLTDHPAQAGVSDASYRIAEGALEHMEIYRAEAFSSILTGLRESYRVVATAIGNHTPLSSLRPAAKPIAVVLGNEEHGLPTSTLKACDEIVTIAARGPVQSLNVSASGAILLYAITQLKWPLSSSGKA